MDTVRLNEPLSHQAVELPRRETSRRAEHGLPGGDGSQCASINRVSSNPILSSYPHGHHTDPQYMFSTHTNPPDTWRKPLLATFASIGALSGILFVLLPTGKTWVPLVVALLTILGNVGYAVGIVCSNAYLPDLAREDERERVGVLGQVALGSGDDQALTMPEQSERDEVEPLLSQPEIAGIPISISPISPTDVAFAATARDTSHLVTTTPTIPDANLPDDPNSLSLTTSRISSTGTAIGFFSGVAVLALLLLPVSLMGGSTASLRLAIALSGVWWAVWSVPAVWGLPGRVDRVGSASLGEGVGMVGHKDTNEDEGWKWGDGWRRVGRMIRWKETKRLKNLFVFLLTWIFLSDGMFMFPATVHVYVQKGITANAQDSTPPPTLPFSTPRPTYTCPHQPSSSLASSSNFQPSFRPSSLPVSSGLKDGQTPKYWLESR